ncbi:unnamed protein product, partial [Linum tenue]
MQRVEALGVESRGRDSQAQSFDQTAKANRSTK